MAYDNTRRKIADFSKLLRKKLGSFEYFRVLERHKNGFPHYHFLARCAYIPQKEVSRIWAELTGNIIVDIRRIDKGANVFRYVLKYLCKQSYVPWTNRRVSWSRGFFPKKEKRDESDNPYTHRKRKVMHPADAIHSLYPGATIEQRRPGVWVILDREIEHSTPPNFHDPNEPSRWQKKRQ